MASLGGEGVLYRGGGGPRSFLKELGAMMTSEEQELELRTEARRGV